MLLKVFECTNSTFAQIKDLTATQRNKYTNQHAEVFSETHESQSRQIRRLNKKSINTLQSQLTLMIRWLVEPKLFMYISTSNHDNKNKESWISG